MHSKHKKIQLQFQTEIKLIHVLILLKTKNILKISGKMMMLMVKILKKDL
jgi:hypothetical protein